VLEKIEARNARKGKSASPQIEFYITPNSSLLQKTKVSLVEERCSVQ
jgi:hypothetical protein